MARRKRGKMARLHNLFFPQLSTLERGGKEDREREGRDPRKKEEERLAERRVEEEGGGEGGLFQFARKEKGDFAVMMAGGRERGRVQVDPPPLSPLSSHPKFRL